MDDEDDPVAKTEEEIEWEERYRGIFIEDEDSDRPSAQDAGDFKDEAEKVSSRPPFTFSQIQDKVTP